MSTFIRNTMTPINGVTENSNTNSNTSTNSNNQPMTPTTSDFNNVIKNQFSSSLDMPSPPLSPYTRDDTENSNIPPTLLFPRATKPLTSDLRYLEKSIKKLNNAKSSIENNQLDTILSNNDNNDNNGENNNKLIESDIISNDNNESKAQNHFPLDQVNKNSILHLDPYQNLNTPNFKKIQLSFLSQYQFKSFNSNSSNNNYLNYSYSYKKSNSNNTGRSASRQVYDTIKNKNYNSNSDSDYEKPRTRRFVKQNKFDLEIDESDSVISRPSTPIKRKQNSNSNNSTPKRQRTSTPVVYNYDYKQIKDYCPSLDTLPSTNKCLKTDWKGQSMDLSNDPLIDELHPAEVVLASILRLPCAVYLDSKRRIFQEKVKRMKYNLPFRRTDAQKSCKIDVNKASRLFASFEKVGWFDEKHFEKFM